MQVGEGVREDEGDVGECTMVSNRREVVGVAGRRLGRSFCRLQWWSSRVRPIPVGKGDGEVEGGAAGSSGP